MKVKLDFANFGQERERIATESELAIFEHLKEMAETEDMELVRKCDDYVTAVFKGWDLARFKYTPRAKWVAFPSTERGTTKHYIESPEDVREYADLLKRSLETINKFA